MYITKGYIHSSYQITNHSNLVTIPPKPPGEWRSPRTPSRILSGNTRSPPLPLLKHKIQGPWYGRKAVLHVAQHLGPVISLRKAELVARYERCHHEAQIEEAEILADAVMASWGFGQPWNELGDI